MTLTADQLPSHTHSLKATNQSSNANLPENAILANTTPLDKEYSTDTSSLVNMSAAAIGFTGSNAPVPFAPPSLGITFIICISGYFPQRS
ncbi:MAG: hypothetical protein OHK0039_38620 [Bacteroidia bacterium]